MRTTTLSLIAATLITLPLAAQNPTRPQPAPRRPAAMVTRPDTGRVESLTEAQHDRLDAIRTRYAKEARGQREAARARREKMREEVRQVLTPSQRARLDERREMMHRRQSGMRVGMAPHRGMRGARGMKMPGRPGAGMRRGHPGMMRMHDGAGMHEMPGMRRARPVHLERPDSGR